MNYYTHHLFFCNNQRQDGKQCCSRLGGKKMYRYAKDVCRDKGLLGQGKIGVSESRCLGRCVFGPVAVVYPDNIWYHYIDEQDIDDIINTHLIGNQAVERLKID